jgi:glycosyltransferase involved in cell wall biosynthesis
MPKVSVIIPNYNHAIFLDRRIDSVLSQTIDDFEVIILDDNSGDNSKAIISQFSSHPTIAHIVYNESNSGSVFRQWKKGLKLAKGQYIWIAESDDAADPFFLEKMIPVLDDNPDVGFVYSDSLILKNGASSGRLFSDFRNFHFKNSKWGQSYINDGRSEITECLWKSCTVNNASAVLFRRSAIEKINPFDRDFRFFGDWYCYLKLCRENKIAYVHEPLNHYNEHSANASLHSRRNLNYVVEYFRIYCWIRANMPEVNRGKLKEQYVSYMSHSVFRNWSMAKVKVYWKLFRMNPVNFVIIWAGIISRITRNRAGGVQSAFGVKEN